MPEEAGVNSILITLLHYHYSSHLPFTIYLAYQPLDFDHKMAYYLQSESSAALISSPSPEATTALEDFRKEHSNGSRYYGCLFH